MGRFWTLVLLGAATACTTDPLSFESMAGTYSGAFSSTEPAGAVFDGRLELFVEQSDGTLTGSWRIVGTISGSGTVNTDVRGGWAGVVPLGADPSFPSQLAYSFCPSDPMDFQMSFDSSERSIRVVGDLEIPDSRCDVLTAYPLDLVLGP